ncbi:hypothetical protein K0P33_17265 [Pseudomonas sp. ArH3a]|uniref:hypothetical protein n=1 Tax=Pseudomonas sp. ArH3a TaxID=2862945 RepID=UPI001F572E94|nr:hypothetical protein [Pseudomonas sp. ArH3a]UNM17333.1 hypothetical protein K0P33_17265 [Pseudomonas sp. ArH3a]
MSEVKRFTEGPIGKGLYVDPNGELCGFHHLERVTAERDAALAQESTLARDAANWKRKACESADREHELQQRLTAADERADRLEQALKFYADGDHLLLADPDAWDTCSGEPVNFLHDDAGTASVEDGSIAKAALKPAEGGGDEQ